MSSYIPREDPAALLWFEAFRDNINLDPAKYMLVAADATSITNAVNSFATALGISTNELTRTKGTIIAKDDARSAVETLCRTYAMQIKVNAGISDDDKVAVGVRPVNPDRTPIPVPSSSPGLVVVAATPGNHTLTYEDSLTPGLKAKPFGADTLQLFVGVADADVIITDPAATQFYGAFTKTPIGVQFDATENGKQATYYARWAAKNGEVGPFSGPATLAIAA